MRIKEDLVMNCITELTTCKVTDFQKVLKKHFEIYKATRKYGTDDPVVIKAIQHARSRGKNTCDELDLPIESIADPKKYRGIV